MIDINLDDPENYDYLPTNIEELGDIMFKEIGFCLWYMDYHMPDVFDKNDPQTKRVKQLIQNFTDGNLGNKNCNNVRWWQQQIFLLQSETENMC